MFSRLFGKKPSKKSIKRPYFKPNLERLEDRLVMDAMRWNPTNPMVDLLWSTPGNWWDITTGAAATAAPSVNDDVQFRGTGQWNNDCGITSPAICKSINSNSPDHYTHALYLSGSSLTVMSASDTDFSDWEYGTIRAVNSAGTLNVLENFTYNGATLNPGAFPTMTVNIGASTFTPYMYFGSGCTFTGATFNVGYNNSGNTRHGTLQFQNNVNPTDLGDQPINVSSMGVLNFSSIVSIVSCGDINSAGYINLGTGCQIDLTNGSNITTTGGYLNSSPSGNSTIIGDVNLTNTYLNMTMAGSNYASINIDGDLIFNNGCRYYYNVMAGDLTRCNKVTATDIYFTAGASVSSYCNSVGLLTPGVHDYIPLEATNSLSGTFSAYVWAYAFWTPSYTATAFHLTRTV